jgi:large subunit ribosomal protein L17
MRHNVAHRRLGRDTQHVRALLRNQAMALLQHERIETTVPKAKELRPFVERLITIAKRGVAARDDAGRALHARRMVLAELPDKKVVGKLFETLAPRFAERPGGYTRILRIGFRRGDSAEVAQIELVGSEYQPKSAEERAAEKDAAEAPKSRGIGERLKAVTKGVGGARAGSGASKGKAQAKGQTSGAAKRQTSTPRKSGGV